MKNPSNQKIPIAWDSKISVKTSEPKHQTPSFLNYYFKNSSINGLKFIAESNNWFERIFWGTALITSILLCTYVLANTFIKWQYKPDIVSHQRKTNVRQIPFPAVTICPQTKTKAHFIVFENVFREIFEGKKVHGDALEESKYFESLLHVCNSQLLPVLKINQSVLQSDEEIIEVLRKISYSVSDSMLFCKWRKKIVDCTELFTEILTDQGFCYTFNLLNQSEIFKQDQIQKDFEFSERPSASWNLQDGYTSNDLDVYPWPIISQQFDALRIILKATDTDTDFICQGSLQGFKIFFHSPDEFPNTIGKHLFVPLEQDATLTMKATTTKASADLLKFKPNIRGCYRSDEKKLKFFKSYTKQNCEIENLNKFILKNCNCTKFSMPREKLTKICKVDQLECSSTCERNWMTMQIGENSSDLLDNCLPCCTEIDYEVEQQTLTTFDFESLFDSYSYDLTDIPGAVMSRLTLYFEDSEFEVSERYAIFGSMDFLASAGGVMGLFMGFSILSLVEIIFYALLWLIRSKKRNQIGSTKVLSKPLTFK